MPIEAKKLVTESLVAVDLNTTLSKAQILDKKLLVALVTITSSPGDL